MNPAFPDQLYNGILICLCIQLILIGIYKLLSKDKRSHLLGAFCLIMGTLFIYNLYWSYFRENAFYSILLANYKNIYFAPILYLYIALLGQATNNKKVIFAHLTLPTIIFLSYTITKHVFKDFYAQHYVNIVVTIESLQLLLSLFYLIAGIKLFKRIRVVLKPKAIRRYLIFYYGLLIYFLIIPTFDLIALFVFPEIMETAFIHLSRFLFMPLGILVYSGTLVFVIIESNELKSLFLGEKLHINKEVINSMSVIDEQMKIHLIDNKKFKVQDIRLKDIAALVGIGDKILAEYFISKYKTNFQEFINVLRIEEFKNLCRSTEYKNFSLSGIAQESGFKSKATFYRAFKKKEGVTPNEYIKESKYS